MIIFLFIANLFSSMNHNVGLLFSDYICGFEILCLILFSRRHPKMFSLLSEGVFSSCSSRSWTVFLDLDCLFSVWCIKCFVSFLPRMVGFPLYFFPLPPFFILCPFALSLMFSIFLERCRAPDRSATVCPRARRRARHRAAATPPSRPSTHSQPSLPSRPLHDTSLSLKY